MLLTKILSFLGSGAVSRITDKIGDAYEAKIRAETDEKKLEAEIEIARLSDQRDIIIAEQGRWYTAWIRPMLALPVVIVVWKLLVWDYVLNWGVSPQPGDLILWIILTIIGAYFITRPFEKR